MRHIKTSHMVVAIFLALVFISSADGKPRPTGPYGGPDFCWADWRNTDAACTGPICYCCYDDGCWICDNVEGGLTNCVWDPKYSSRNLPQTEPTSISPGSGKVPLKQPPTGLQTEPISINPESGKIPLKPTNGTLIQAGPLNVSSESAQNQIIPPNVPSIPSGPTTGRPSRSYAYSTSATDPNGDQVKYTFDWGDGTSPSATSLVNSGEKASLPHRWARTGTYLVKAMATNSKGAASDWSSTLSVKISTTGRAQEEEQGQNNNQEQQGQQGQKQNSNQNQGKMGNQG